MTAKQVAWFTSVNLKYMDRAAILSETMKNLHPEWTGVLLLVDDQPTDEEFKFLSRNFDLILHPSELGIPSPTTWFKPTEAYYRYSSIQDWLSDLSVVERCTAVKPFTFQYLAQTFEIVLYLDPDIAVFNSLRDIENCLTSDYSIAVTPHQLAPAKSFQAIIDNELGSLKTGVFNFGFLGINSSKINAIHFIEFWAERLKYFCSETATDGTFTDQKWGDFLPSFYDDLYILRHPGMNVANWNLENREIRFGMDGQCSVNELPLIFYHFSKANSAGLVMTERYSEGNPAVADLWRWYLNKLEANTLVLKEAPWGAKDR